MTPLDLELDEVLAFTLPALPPPPASVLEVGCGDGRVAERLAALGYTVTAIDVDAGAVAAARARGVNASHADFLGFAGGPFDALLFTRSFHHIAPLHAAVARAREVLRPGGALVLDEFAHDEVDRFTATWFFDLIAALEAAGVTAPDEPRHHPHRGHGHGHAHGHHDDCDERPVAPPRDPLEHWRWRLAHDPPLHGARAMVDALGAAFAMEPAARLVYLHRYLADRLRADATGARVFTALRRLEAERVAQGILVPVGLRLVGKRL